MTITERQNKILDNLITEYIKTAKPVSSTRLQKKCGSEVCPATIRNELQVLTKNGFIEQPHISAGRIPTKKAYKHFADKIASERENAFSSFIFHEIKTAREQIEQEMKLAEELMTSLSEASLTLSISHMPLKDDLFEILNILGPSKITFGRNINIINEIIKELENF